MWTLYALSKALERETGVVLSVSEIGRILRSQGLRPHRMQLWLHSPDPLFREKVRVICDLYLKRPAGAHVVCVDEKTSIQALSRKHPTKPPAPGRAGRREFEYVKVSNASRTENDSFSVSMIHSRSRRARSSSLLRKSSLSVGEQIAAYVDCTVHRRSREVDIPGRRNGRVFAAVEEAGDPEHRAGELASPVADRIEVALGTKLRLEPTHEAEPAFARLGGQVKRLRPGFGARPQPQQSKQAPPVVVYHPTPAPRADRCRAVRCGSWGSKRGIAPASRALAGPDCRRGGAALGAGQ